MREFEGRTAVITGGASGIGLAFAHRFGREGCRIMLADIERTALDAALDGLRDAGITAFGEIADVADADAVERLAARTAERFGKVHLLCNNAGVSITGPTWRMSPDDWRWVWGVNMWGVVNGIRAFLPAMMAHGEPAHVINTGSLASFFGNGDHAPYCSSKAAVLGLSQSLYSEMKAMKTNVGVTIVCPGMVATRINQSWRNRPDADRPWSDREFADQTFRENSDAFQGAGVSAEVIAEAALDAVRNDRFYSFAGDRWPAFLRGVLEPALRGEDPPVATWGEDRRSEEERIPAPWTTAAGGV
jgi:NAD(P)-dependent dehydrogenase (short-subunit alcohol dehydrogenase family)